VGDGVESMTPGVLKALSIPPEQQVGFMLAKLSEIGAGMKVQADSTKRIEKNIDDIKGELAKGQTTFALQEVAIRSQGERIVALEKVNAEKSRAPAWWVTSIVCPLAVLFLAAVVWFLMSGIVAAHAPQPAQARGGQ